MRVRKLLLDVSSLMYRAFFAVPQTVKDGDGHPVNAVRGYLDMTAELVRSRKPAEIVHAYDDNWKPDARVAAYAGYKAARKPEPEELTWQFGLLRDVLDAFGFLQASASGWEAEDAIGSLCARANDGDRIGIVTGDRDLLQLVRDPAVVVLSTVRGVSDLKEFDEAEVRAKHGIAASRYAEYAILRGDPSDGLPGVAGIGEKTARELVNAYPSLDALLDDAARPIPRGRVARSPALVKSLRASAGYIAAMREVVPIRTDLEVTRWSKPRNDAAVDDLTDRHNLGGPVGRLRAALAGQGAATQAAG